MSSNQGNNEWEGKKFFKPNTKQYEKSDPHKMNEKNGINDPQQNERDSPVIQKKRIEQKDKIN